MPNPNAFVSTSIRLDPPLDRDPEELLRAEKGLSVELEDGRRVLLDPSNPMSAGFARVLDGLSRQGLPVYVEFDPENNTITRLLIPHVTRVSAVRRLDEGVLSVELELSHGRHVLRASNPDFEDLEGEIRRALETGNPVILTEDDAHNILDVRFFTPGPDGPFPDFPEPRLPPEVPIEPPLWHLIWGRIRCWLLWPWCWLRCVSAKKAQDVFDDLASTSCDPLTVPPPCIPFLYPDDGCWGRAHEMCRLMIDMGLKPRKVWIEGGLQVDTANNPACGVWWNWHVAPTLCVRGPGWFRIRTMVMDPALFDTPVTKATWKGVQNDPSATLTDSSASIFYLWGSVTDPSYTQSDAVLATYRLALQNRANQNGPPPYSCP